MVPKTTSHIHSQGGFVKRSSKQPHSVFSANQPRNHTQRVSLFMEIILLLRWIRSSTDSSNLSASSAAGVQLSPGQSAHPWAGTSVWWRSDSSSNVWSHGLYSWSPFTVFLYQHLIPSTHQGHNPCAPAWFVSFICARISEFQCSGRTLLSSSGTTGRVFISGSISHVFRDISWVFSLTRLSGACSGHSWHWPIAQGLTSFLKFNI